MAASVAKTHREALGKACADDRLHQNLTPKALGLGPPESYAGNFRSAVDVSFSSDALAHVTVHLKALGKSVPAQASVQYTGECDACVMTWSRSSSPPDLLVTEPRGHNKPAA